MNALQEASEGSRPFRELCESARSERGCHSAKTSRPTEPEQPLIRHIATPAHHITGMALRELIITDVKALHVGLLKLGEHVRDFLLALRTLELERDIDLRKSRVIIPVNKLGRRAGVDSTVESKETARLFWYLNAEECFATLTELRTLSDKAQSVKVHVGTADDGDESLLCANESILYDVSLESC